MDTKTEKRFQEREQMRLSRYQYQHRGLRFSKLWLPPPTERRVNIIGLNNHIYRGQIPTLPMDQLPPEVDSDSIDDEALYKELFNMTFPKGKQEPREPTGPSRRIGGSHTTTKRLYFAPVIMHSDEDRRRAPILGADGNIYRGTTKAASVHELEQKLKGTKSTVPTAAMQSSRREHVEPVVVSLHVDGKSPMECKPQVPLIQLPIADLNKMIKYIRKKEAEIPGVTDTKGTERSKEPDIAPEIQGTDAEATPKGEESVTTESGSEDTSTESSEIEELSKNKESEVEQSSTEPSELDTPSELEQSGTELSEELDASSELEEQSGTEPSEELGTPSEFQQSGAEPTEELGTPSDFQRSGTEPSEELGTPSELQQSGKEPSEELGTPSDFQRSGTEPPEELGTPSELQQSGTEPSEELVTPSELQQSGKEPSEELVTPSELQQSGTASSEKKHQTELEATKVEYSGNEAEIPQKEDSQGESQDAEVYSL